MKNALSKIGKFFFSLAIFVLIIAILGIIASIFALSYYDEPSNSIPQDGTVFTITSGESGQEIARKLEEEGLIRSRYYFLFVLRKDNKAGALKKGEYNITKDMSTSDIVDLLVKGKQQLIKVTIPEGLCFGDIAQIAEEANICTKQDFLETVQDKSILSEYNLSSMMGYLYPETYYLPKNAGASQLIHLMINTFFEKLYENVPEAKELSKKELENRIILASIVEREYRRPEEAAKIAGVFWNRINIHMGLQSCATVEYIITEIQGKPHPKRIFELDTQIDNPYNTYVYEGLPPGAICNPGLVAIVATFRPESSDYLYFRLVNEQSGEHHFSKTLNEHIKAGSLLVKPKR